MLCAVRLWPVGRGGGGGGGGVVDGRRGGDKVPQVFNVVFNKKTVASALLWPTPPSTGCAFTRERPWGRPRWRGGTTSS